MTSEDEGDWPEPPDLPAYLTDPLRRLSPERLETVAAYARRLAAWKRRQADEEEEKPDAPVDDQTLERLESRGVSTDPEAYESVPAGAYVTVKETKPGYRYYYWQWRDGEQWKNEYIAPVQSRRGETESGHEE